MLPHPWMYALRHGGYDAERAKKDISDYLTAFDGNISELAREAGISRMTALRVVHLADLGGFAADLRARVTNKWRGKEGYATGGTWLRRTANDTMKQ